jgi:hypothetical protein
VEVDIDDKLTIIIMENLVNFENGIELAQKLVFFKDDGVIILQGVKRKGHHTIDVETCFIFEWCALLATPHKLG